MKNRAARALSLRAIFSYFSNVEILLLTPRSGLGAIRKLKTRADRLNIL